MLAAGQANRTLTAEPSGHRTNFPVFKLHSLPDSSRVKRKISPGIRSERVCFARSFSSAATVP